MNLRYLMMMRRVDAACARMNTGLAAVAIALSVTIGAAATLRLAQFSAEEPGHDMPPSVGDTSEAPTSGW